MDREKQIRGYKNFSRGFVCCLGSASFGGNTAKAGCKVRYNCRSGWSGSNIAIALVRIEVRHLLFLDFNHVDLANLNRQQCFLDQVGRKRRRWWKVCSGSIFS